MATSKIQEFGETVDSLAAQAAIVSKPQVNDSAQVKAQRTLAALTADAASAALAVARDQEARLQKLEAAAGRL